MNASSALIAGHRQPTPYCWRVTKYDPKLRDEHGYFTGDEWTHFAQVGTECDGHLLTMQEYERVEAAYLDAALAFVEEAAMPTLLAREVEHGALATPHLQEGAAVPHGLLRAVMRSILRNRYWCKLEGQDCYLHFGCDYDMFIGASRDCPAARARAHSMGLFVEEFESPYLTADEW